MIKKKAIIVIIFLSIITIGLFSWIFYPKGILKHGTVSPDSSKVQINEIFYSGSSASDEWVEIYVFENVTFSSWYITTYDNDVQKIPSLKQELKESDYVVIHFGIGNNSFNSESHEYHLYLNNTGEILDDSGDEVGIYDGSGRLVDFMRYNGGNSGVVFGNWSENDSGISVSGANDSISLWGVDLDNSSNWIESQPTPASPNVYEFIPENFSYPIRLYSGVWLGVTTIYFNASGDMKFLGGNKIAVTGNPGPNAKLDKVKEYASFSLKYYKELGFGDPELGKDGAVDIHVSKGSDSECSGVTYSNGSVFIKVGKKKSDIDLKYVVEHELFHTLQFKMYKDSGGDYRHDNPKSDDWFFDEGMATYWGIRSAMKNFNKTMKEVMDEFKRIGEHNWYSHYTSFNSSFGYKWGGTYTDYIGSFFFIKFIMEKYGIEKLKQIHEAIKNYKNDSLDVNAKKAIENVLGKPFDRIFREFLEWRMNEAPTLNKAPEVKPDATIPYNGSNVSENATVLTGGAALENISISSNESKPFHINMNWDSDFIITVIIVYRDGTTRRTWFKLYKGGTYAPIPIDPKKVKHVIMIKQCIEKNKNGSIKIDLVPVETTPPPGTHDNPETLNNNTIEGNLGFTPGVTFPDLSGDDGVYFNTGDTWAKDWVWTFSFIQNQELYEGMETLFTFQILNSTDDIVFTETTRDFVFVVPSTDDYKIRIESNGEAGFFSIVSSVLL
ncbi:MAG: lamin tail domain-containing protein [Promethearchaeota archaeon]